MKTITIAITIILLAFATLARSQGLVVNGANLIISTNTYLVTDGATGNFSVQSGDVQLHGRLQATGNLTNNGTLTAAANENEEATIKVSGTVTGSGTFNVETYLTSGRNWYVSSPVSGAKASVFNAASNPVFWYDEAHGSTLPWVAITDNTSDLVPYKGYIATVPNSENVTFTGGTLNNSNQTLTLYRTAGQTKEGFNLVGNPYPAYYDFGSSTKTNIQPSLWYRAKNADNTAYVFDTYSLTNRLGTSLSGKAVTCNIPPMQAFWVRVDNGQNSGTISFDKQYANHCDLSTNRRRSPEVSNAKHIRLQVSNGQYFDETILVFNPLASDEFDAYDSPKMSNGSAAIPELYSKAGNEIVAINGLKTFTTEGRIPLGFNTTKKDTFTLKATELVGFDAQQKIVLYDIEKGVEHDLTSLSNYEFSSPITNTLSRFEIRFKASELSTNLTDSNDSFASFIRNSNREITLNYSGLITGNENVTVCNAAGIALQSNRVVNLQTKMQLPYPAGLYILKAQLGQQSTVQKIIIQ